jgi:peroxiredoxin
MALLNPGDPFPSLTLTRPGGERLTVPDAFEGGFGVVLFYRGSWCPYCNLALHALQAILLALTAKGVTLVAITPEVPSEALSTAEKNALAFPVLSDIGNIYAAQLGILFPMPDEMKSVFDGGGIDLKNRNGDESLVVPVPATILVGRDGIVKKVFIEADYSMRLEPSVALEWIDEMLEG